MAGTRLGVHNVVGLLVNGASVDDVVKTRRAECAHLLRLLRSAGESGLAGNVNFT